MGTKNISDWKMLKVIPTVGHANIKKERIKEAIKNMPDEEYINPEERLRSKEKIKYWKINSTSTKA